MPQISKKARLENAKKSMSKYFKEHSVRVLSFDSLKQILDSHRNVWGLAQTTRIHEFIQYLIDNEIIFKELIITLPHDKKSHRYALDRDYSEFDVALSLNPKAYFSHYSAMLLNDLTQNVPKNIYMNREQTIKPSYRSELKQHSIDESFKKPMRATNNIARFDSYKIFLINGKNTKNIGVEKHQINGYKYMVTNIERTLIDIVVRPDYSGGPNEILKAFEFAKGKFSINIMISYLKKINHFYPYQQAIGFYMDRAGYDEKHLKLIESLKTNYTFYLNYNTKQTDYNERWNIKIPKGF